MRYLKSGSLPKPLTRLVGLLELLEVENDHLAPTRTAGFRSSFEGVGRLSEPEWTDVADVSFRTVAS